MSDFLARVFVPPPFPPVDLGGWAKVNGTESLMRAAWEATYFAGVKDGFLAGAVAALAFVLGVVLWRSPGVRSAVS